MYLRYKFQYKALFEYTENRYHIENSFKSINYNLKCII